MLSVQYVFIYLVLLLLFIGHPANAQQCTKNNCNLKLFNQPTNAKVNATYTVRIGSVYNNAIDANSLVAFAMATINNDTSILPDVRLELYYLNFTTAEQAVLVMYGMVTNNVSAVIVNTGDDFVPQASAISQAWQIPIYVSRSMDDAYRTKVDIPMVSRVFPTSTGLTQGMVAMLKNMNYSGALLITTKDAHVSAAAETFAEQALERGIKNVYTVSIPKYPSSTDIQTAVQKCLTFIAEYQLRPIVFLTATGTGSLMMSALTKANVYGKDFMYMYAYDMSRMILSKLAPKDAGPTMDGAYLFFTRDAAGSRYPTVSKAWAATSSSYFPGTRPTPGSQWFVYDAVYAYAYALDAVIKSGVPFDQVKYSDVLAATPGLAFNGVSGIMEFDTNRDYVNHNGFQLYNVLNYTSFSFNVVSIYNPVNNTFLILKNYTYYNMSSIPPNPGFCKICIYGVCNSQSQCVCNLGYTGQYCSDTVSTIDNRSDITIEIVIPIVGVIVIAAGIAVWYFKKRREQFIKDMQLQQRSEITRDEIKLTTRIGRGASGAVYKATFRGTEVAVKSLLTLSTSSNAVESFKMETAIMCTLRHPNIVLFMGSCFDGAQKEMLIVMEFCSRGSLHDILYEPKSNLPYDLLLHLACQAAQGMNFLHESKPPIIHRDLKSHNILLDDKFNAKISDFGITRFKDADKKADKGGKPESLGTVFWTAPEALSGKVHTEKSDSYSFGIVLWEMMHRHDPYPGMDIVTVAMDVMNKGIRPEMNPNTPPEMQDLIRECWRQDPLLRPDFSTIMMRLRGLSMQHPLHTFSSGGHYQDPGFDAPSGNVYMVFSRIDNLYNLFDSLPRPTKHAFAMHNTLLRSNLELYEGYEVKNLKDGFFMVFPNCSAAVNWCIATQVSLMHLQWPQAILDNPETREVFAQNAVVSRGLRVRMSIHVGTPEMEINPATGRMNYLGPVVKRAKEALKQFKYGSIIADSPVIDEITSKKVPLIEEITSKLSSEALPNGDFLYQILPNSLAARQDNEGSHTNDEFLITSFEESSTETKINFSQARPSLPAWLIPFPSLSLLESVGRGQVGDYSRALWDSREVVAKLLVNQKLREEDYLGLISDIATLSKVKHPNLLPIHGLCLKPGNISIIMDYVSGGSLRDLLSRDTPLSVPQLVAIAREIAVGMLYLTTHPNPELHIHDNFKSTNILVTKDLQVKITDYAQTNIKDLARTMTSISSVSWTAPEILNGEPITTKSSVYSFGIILWELFSRKIVWEGEHPLKAVAKILNGVRPAIPECPPAMKELMQSCWDPEPDQRPTWHVIISELSHAI